VVSYRSCIGGGGRGGCVCVEELEELERTHQEQQSILMVDMKKEMAAMQKKILVDCVSSHTVDTNVSQGSVAAHAGCGGIFNHRFTANLPRNGAVKKFCMSVYI